MVYSYDDAGDNEGEDYVVPQEYLDNPKDLSSHPDNQDSVPSYDHSFALQSSRKRYMAMAVYMVLITLQIYIIHTFNPLDSQPMPFNSTATTIDTTEDLFTNQDVTNLSVIFFACVFLLSTPFAVITRLLSLKICMVGSSALTLLAAFLRWVILLPDFSRVRTTVYVTHTMQSLASAFSLVFPCIIALLWFPGKERRTATGVFMLSGYLGVAIAYLGGIILEDRHVGGRGGITESEAMNVFLSQFIISAIVFVGTLFLFPSAPLKAANILLLTDRQDMWSSMRELPFKAKFWVTLTITTLVVGAYLNFFYNLSHILAGLGIESRIDHPGSVNALATFVGFVGGVIVLKLTEDVVRLFLFIVGLVLSIDVCFAIVTGISLGADTDGLHQDTIARSVVAFISIMTMLMETVSVLLVEFLLDFSYPAPEELNFSFYLSATGLIPALLLGTWTVKDGSVPTREYSVANVIFTFCCLGVATAILPFLIGTRNERRRLELDYAPQNDVLEPLLQPAYPDDPDSD